MKKDSGWKENKIKQKREEVLTFLLDATGERISSKARRATTNRVVIDNLAPSVDAAGTGTGVDALLFDARSVLSTVWADHALRPACRGRAHEASKAWAHGVPVDLSTLTVRATRWRLTRVLWRLSCRRKDTCNLTEQRKRQRIKVTVREEGKDVWLSELTSALLKLTVLLKNIVFYFRCIFLWKKNKG